MHPVERHGEPPQPHWITPARYRGVATECAGHQQDGDHHDRPAEPHKRPSDVEPVHLHVRLLAPAPKVGSTCAPPKMTTGARVRITRSQAAKLHPSSAS